MDGSIGAYAAKTHLSQLLDRVEHGESLTITRNGKPVARLVPVAPETAATASGSIAERFRAFSEKLRAEGVKPFTTDEIVDLIRSGRKY
jgi:prevent-host-death family protein